MLVDGDFGKWDSRGTPRQRGQVSGVQTTESQFADPLVPTLQYKGDPMDISQAVAFSKFLLPVAGSWAVLRIARLVQWRWLRTSIKTIASVSFACSAILVLLLLAVQAGCSKSAPPIFSPDGRHVAILHYVLQGALGDDYAVVDVRERWTPWAENAYRGLGSWDFEHGMPFDPEVRWIDNSHLSIRFLDGRTGKEGRGAPPTCLSRIGAVQIAWESRSAGSTSNWVVGWPIDGVIVHWPRRGLGGRPTPSGLFLSRNLLGLTTNDRVTPDPEAAVASRRLERYAAISEASRGR